MIDRNIRGVSQVEWWYNYLLIRPKYHCVGMTVLRLKKVKEDIIMDKRLRDDMLRHTSMLNWAPCMAEINMDKAVFDHWIGNFVSRCREILVEKGVLLL